MGLSLQSNRYSFYRFEYRLQCRHINRTTTATSKPEDDALKLMALDFNDENDRLKTINGSVALEQGQMAYSTGKDGTGCA